MIATGIFLFLLGTKLGESTLIKSDVKYKGPSDIKVSEEIITNPIEIPGLGVPPFVSNFIHQGSNFFFNPQIVLPAGPPFVKEIISTVEKKIECDNITIVSPPELDILVEEVPVPIPPVEVVEIVEVPEIPVIIPEAPVIEEIIVPEPVIIKIPEAPELPSLVIPELPLPNPPVEVIVTEPQTIIIEPPVVPEVSIPVWIEEVDVKINEIPPPPELPPLVITDIPKPILVEEKQVVLIPAPPAVLPPPLYVVEQPFIPTVCAQNIVLERFLPNIMFQNTKRMELISIPATRQAPLVTVNVFK